MSGMRRTRTLLFASLSILVLGVLALLAMLLRQGTDHDRVIMEYTASRALSSMMDAFVEDPDTMLPDRVVEFGVYDTMGTAVATAGGAPERILVPAEHGGGEWAVRDGTTLILTRASGGRGLPGRGGAASRGAPGGRLFWRIRYDVSAFVREQRIRVAAITGLALTIVTFSLLTVRLVNGMRALEARSRRTEALAQLGAAARTIAHEIKNPLAAIRLQTTLLRRTIGHEDAVGAPLSVIDDEVARLGALAEGVRSFLSDPRGTPEPIDVCAAVRRLTERLSYPVTVECHGEAPMMVMMDRLRFDSALTNLCNNAARAQGDTAAEPVRIAVDTDGTVVRFSVSDRGPGIPPGQRERVFDPFFTTADGGSGVGLAATRTFVEASGGSIAIGDRDGGGAIVTIRMPRTEGSA